MALTVRRARWDILLRWFPQVCKASVKRTLTRSGFSGGLENEKSCALPNLGVCFSHYFDAADRTSRRGKLRHGKSRVRQGNRDRLPIYQSPRANFYGRKERQRRNRKMELRSEESDHAGAGRRLGQEHAQTRRRHHGHRFSSQKRFAHLAPPENRAGRWKGDG